MWRVTLVKGSRVRTYPSRIAIAPLPVDNVDIVLLIKPRHETNASVLVKVLKGLHNDETLVLVCNKS
jgi:hypothetical protein